MPRPAVNRREGYHEWLAARPVRQVAEVSWPKPDLAEIHLRLVAAASAGLADPLTIVDTQRRELLRRLRDAQRAAVGHWLGMRSGPGPGGSIGDC